MSSHEWTQENLDAYLAGGLTAAERQDVESHSAACAECAQTLADSRKLEHLMDDLFANSRPDAALEDRAIARLRKSRLTRASLLRFSAAAAAVLVLGMVGAAVQAIAKSESPLGAISRGDPADRMLTGLSVDNSRSMSKQDGRFSVVDTDPAAVEFDTDISYNVDRKEKVSVPGAVNPDDAFGIKNGNLEFFPPALAIVTDGTSKVTLGKLREGGGLPGAKQNEVLEDEGKKRSHKFKLELGTQLEGWSRGFSAQVEAQKESKKEEGAQKAPESAFGMGLSDGYFKPPQQAKQDPTKTPPPPKGGGLAGFQGKDKDKEKDKGEKTDPKPGDPAGAVGRKIIRTGTVEFEIDEFDAAYEKVKVLIKKLDGKGAFIATVNSEKLPNGKVLGSIVVRMPPTLLDDFISDLRRELVKALLISQRIGSQDVTKQYTDVESELRAARAVEERLIDIIKTKKGDIKDLVAAEAELGKWRTKIEKMEGEMRYYNNQISLSTLTISLVEREILAPFALVISDHVKMRIEVDDVARLHEAALKALKDVKGRVTKAEVKQHKAGQFEGILQAQVAPERKKEFRAALEKLGIVTEHEDTQRQQAIGGSGKPQKTEERIEDVHFDVTFNNIANVEPRQTAHFKLAIVDVPAAFAQLKEQILASKGQIRDGKINEQDKQNITATLDFNVPTEHKAAFDKLIAEAGPVLTRASTQLAPTEFATERKFGYKLTLFSVASIPPRETVTLKIEVKDVDKRLADLKEMVIAGKGRVVDANVGRAENGQVTAVVTVDVKLAVQDLLVRQIKEAGNLLSQQTSRDPAVPENELTTARIQVTLSGVYAGKTPRETARVRLEVKNVDEQAGEMKKLVRGLNGRVADEKSGRQANGQVSSVLVFEVPLSAQDALVQQFKSTGTLITFETARNTQVPDNELATAQITVALYSSAPIVGNDEGLWSYVRQSLNFSFKIFAWCLLAIITGLSALVPICIVIGVGYVAVRWMWPGEQQAAGSKQPAAVVATPAGDAEKPAS